MTYTARIEPHEAFADANFWAWNTLWPGRRFLVVDYDGYGFKEVVARAREAALESEFDRPHLTIYGGGNRVVYSRRVIGRKHEH